MKTLSVLGSTGSIGRQTLDVVDWSPEGEFRIAALAAFSNVELLTEQALRYQPELVVIVDENKYAQLKDALAQAGVSCRIACGAEGVIEAATLSSVDMVVAAISGVAGLLPVIRAIEAGKDIALANKEVLVAGGHIVMDLAREKGVQMLPVDSEHSAIWQCLPKDGSGGVESLLLTASGGPFRDFTKEQLMAVTPAQALAHPTWNMGPKISIDSSTLMNKGLEIIEAHWLFDVPYEKIQVVVHPQSIIHSMVQYQDSAILAHLGYPDMRVPIQLALTWPKRKANALKRIDFADLAKITFGAPDYDRFPCLALAKEAGNAGGSMPVVLNGANEVLVWRFIRGEIGFWDIPTGVEKVLALHQRVENPDLDTILAVDLWSREQASALFK